MTKQRKRRGFWLKLDSGEWVHVLGDPALANDDKFKQAIEQMAEAAKKESEKNRSKGK